MDVNNKITIWFATTLIVAFFVFIGVAVYADFSKQQHLKDNGFVYLKGWYPSNMIKE